MSFNVKRSPGPGIEPASDDLSRTSFLAGSGIVGSASQDALHVGNGGIAAGSQSAGGVCGAVELVGESRPFGDRRTGDHLTKRRLQDLGGAAAASACCNNRLPGALRQCLQPGVERC